MGLSSVGLLILIFGVVVIAFSEKLGQKLFPGSSHDISNALLISNSGGSSSTAASKDTDENDAQKAFDPALKQRGVIYALTVGLFGGSILAPLNYVPPEQAGLVFVPSFGLGAFMAASIVLSIVVYLNGKNDGPPIVFNWQWGLPLGILSGTIFQLSNVFSIVAIPTLGYGLAYPLLQCAIFFSGIWSDLYIFLFTFCHLSMSSFDHLKISPLPS